MTVTPTLMLGLLGCDETSVNVANLVRISAETRRCLDGHVQMLAAQKPSGGAPRFEYQAHVQPDGALVIACITDRGHFAIRVEPHDWRWTQAPA